MPLKTGDLRYTILKKISLDEFTPKSGDEEDVAVLGFFVTESYPGDDLYNFLSNSEAPIRTVELSPNPNEDGYYMVFVEVERNIDLLKTIKKITKEVERLSGNLRWCIKTPFMNDYVSLDDDLLPRYIQFSNEEYLEPQKFKNKLKKDLKDSDEEDFIIKTESHDFCNNSILDFLQKSDLFEARLIRDVISMKGSKYNARLQIVNFGPLNKIMKETGINESAVGDIDYRIKEFNLMLGYGLESMPIGDYIVIYDPDGDENSNALITRRL